MDSQTRYGYEKNIKELRRELSETAGKLEYYRNVASDIFTTMTINLSEDKTTNQGWILSQFRRLWK